MKKIHVLPGDSLFESFRETGLEGETAICRECLVDGDLKAESLDEFWKVRAGFIESAFGEDEKKYYREVVAEFEKLNDLAASDEVNLWFEYELFCQANMWFCLYFLRNTSADIYRVAPVVRNETDLWKGFGDLNAEDLRKCFNERIKFGAEDVALGVELWRAFQNSDDEKLEKLSRLKSPCFPHLEEVCRAAVEKNFRPQNILLEIKGSGYFVTLGVMFFVAVGLLIYFWRKGWIFEKNRADTEMND